MCHYLVDTIALLMKLVDRHFVVNPKVDEQGARQARRESYQVDKKCSFETPEAPIDNEKVVS